MATLPIFWSGAWSGGVEVVVTLPLAEAHDVVRPVRAPISALVVDDEPLARRNLTILLRGDPDIGSIEECASGAEAVEVIRQRKPDLVFLDVQMPECGGFDVLELLGADCRRRSSS